MRTELCEIPAFSRRGRGSPQSRGQNGAFRVVSVGATDGDGDCWESGSVWHHTGPEEEAAFMTLVPRDAPRRSLPSGPQWKVAVFRNRLYELWKMGRAWHLGGRQSRGARRKDLSPRARPERKLQKNSEKTRPPECKDSIQNGAAEMNRHFTH